MLVSGYMINGRVVCRRDQAKTAQAALVASKNFNSQ
jgi:hypothetical protein